MGGHYPASNMVLLRILQNDRIGAREWARLVIADAQPDAEGSASPIARCWALASMATAHIALGETGAAVAALRASFDADPGNLGAHAATRRQVRLLCDALHLDLGPERAALDAPVVFYTGHIVSADDTGRFPAALAPAARTNVQALVKSHAPVASFGGLAAGGDILFAEALLAVGAELHVVLPFAEADYIRLSVQPAGGDWQSRYAACIEAATSVRQLSDEAYQGDPIAFTRGARYAMGLAALRARQLELPVIQLALHDGSAAMSAAGTAADVGFWTGLGRISDSVWPSASEQPRLGTDIDQGQDEKAILFGDFTGFSGLCDTQTRTFIDVVLGAIAAALAPAATSILYRNTWGDGLVFIFNDIRVAVGSAQKMLSAINAIDFTACGLPATLALRLGGHWGPLSFCRDPIH